MRHYSEDTLLKASLKILDSDEYREVLEHLESCEQCRSKYSAIVQSNEVIAGYEPGLPPPVMLRLPAHKNFKLRLLNTAAVLLIGFGLGYLTGFMNHPAPIKVTRQTLITNSAAVANPDFVHNEMLDLNIDFGF